MLSLFGLFLVVCFTQIRTETLPYSVIPESPRIAPPCWRDIDGYKRVAIYWDYTMVIDDVLLHGEESTGFSIHGKMLFLEPSFVQRLEYQCKSSIQVKAFHAQQVNDSFTCYDFFATFPPLSSEIPLECYNDTYIIRNNTNPVPCHSVVTCSAVIDVSCLNMVSPVTGNCFTIVNCTQAFSDCLIFCSCLYFRPHNATNTPTSHAPTKSPSAFPTRAPTKAPTSPTNTTTGVPTTTTGTPTTESPTTNTFPWEAFGIALVVIMIIVICCLFIAILAIRRSRGTLNYRG